MRDKFNFFRSYLKPAEILTDAEFGFFVKQMCNYALDDAEPVLEGTSKTLWEMIKPSIDKGIKISEVRTEAGKKGLDKRWQTNSKPIAKESQADSEEEIEIEKEKSSSIREGDDEEDDGIDWDKLLDEWAKNQWNNKPGSPLQCLQHGKFRDEQKEVIRERVHDCMAQYKSSYETAKSMLYKVLLQASDVTDKNYLRSNDFRSKVNFNWLIRNKKNFFDVLDGNYLRK